jgi:hypothetical protein
MDCVDEAQIRPIPLPGPYRALTVSIPFDSGRKALIIHALGEMIVGAMLAASE